MYQTSKTFIVFIILNSLLMPVVHGQESIQSEFVFEIKAKIADVIPLGDTKDGKRQAIPITGGSFSGRSIKGEVIPGGADYQLVRPDGIIEVNAIYMIRTDDGAVINVENSGIIDTTGGKVYIRTAPKFTAPTGPYDWLNKHLFLGSIHGDPEQPGYVFIRVYKVLQELSGPSLNKKFNRGKLE